MNDSVPTTPIYAQQRTFCSAWRHCSLLVSFTVLFRDYKVVCVFCLTQDSLSLVSGSQMEWIISHQQAVLRILPWQEAYLIMEVGRRVRSPVLGDCLKHTFWTILSRETTDSGEMRRKLVSEGNTEDVQTLKLSAFLGPRINYKFV